MDNVKKRGVVKRRIKQCAALVTLLGGAGVGVHQVTTGGFLPNAQPVTPLPLHAESSPKPTTLDAVAAAWEAETTTLDATSTAAQPVPTETTETEPAIAEPNDAAEPVAELPSSQGLVPVDEPQAVADVESVDLGDRYSSMPVATPDTGNAIARGQEPLNQPDEIGSTPPEANRASIDRARAAFGAPTPSANENRYGTAPAPLQALTPPQDETPSVDPFTGPASLDSSPTPPAPGNAAADSMPRMAPPAAADYNAALAEQDAYNFQPTNPLPTEPAPSAAARDHRVRELTSREPDRGFGAASQLTGVTSDQGSGRPGERALEGPQQPALVVQQIAPAEIQVGKPATFRIQVKNVGDRPAESVTIRDPIPQGTRLISTSPRAEAASGEVIWQLGTMSVGEEREVEIQLMPTSEGEIGSVASVTFATPASVKTRCTLPQLALRLSANERVMIGQEQRVRIELHNPGSGDATGVVLLENVPEELRHDAGPALEFDVGTLRAGETREMELVLTAERPGQVVNRILARGDGNLQVEQEIEFEVIAPGLEVGVEGPRVRYLERPATYTVRVENPGTATAKDIELVTKLPKGLQFVRANNLGEYDAASHAVYWSLAELPEGELGAVELTALPVASGEHEILVAGKARQGLQDETSQYVKVEGLAAIMFEVIDLEDPIEVDGETSYEIRVVNQGSKAATNVQVAASVTPGMKVISATGETRHAIQAGGVIFEPLASLAPKADTVYRLQVQGVRAGDQRITVQVDTDDISQPIRKEESTRVFGDE